MKNNAYAKAATSRPLKRTSRDAEAELRHLESILTYLAGAGLDARPLASGYWRARISELESGHLLLAAQLVRLAALKGIADALNAPSALAARDVPPIAA